jgi:hypothetical protein
MGVCFCWISRKVRSVNGGTAPAYGRNPSASVPALADSDWSELKIPHKKEYRFLNA